MTTSSTTSLLIDGRQAETTEETWRPVPSCPGLSASSLGRIRVDRYEMPTPTGGTRAYGGHPTYGQWDGKRFIYSRKGHKTAKVHRLVCEAFNGAPLPGQVCMHDDENAANNKPGNLKWGTQKQNLNYPGFKSYCRARTGENSPAAKGAQRKDHNATL